MVFAKGSSGNPGGRPKVAAHIRDLAREHSADAFDKILSLLDDKSSKIALAAAQEILNRAYGRPPATIAGDGGEGPAELVIVTGIRRSGDEPPAIGEQITVAIEAKPLAEPAE